ncbi:MAG: hypothetical protein AB1393_11300 [Candidatus Edwardsbacteria bacterium]
MPLNNNYEIDYAKIIHILLNRDSVLNLIGRNEPALKDIKNGLKIARRFQSQRGQAISFIGISKVYLEQEEYVEAREYISNAEKIANEIGEKELMQMVAVSFGELEIAQLWEHLPGCDLSSLERLSHNYDDVALKLAEELKSKLGRAEALLLQARIMVEQASLPVVNSKWQTANSKWQTANSKFQEVIVMFEELKQPFEVAKAYYYYGEALKHTPRCFVGTPLSRGETHPCPS